MLKAEQKDLAGQSGVKKPKYVRVGHLTWGSLELVHMLLGRGVCFWGEKLF